MQAPRVFETLPRGLGALIRPELPSLAEEIVHRIRETIPEYTRPLEGPYGQTIRLGVEQALSQFADQITNPAAPQDMRAEVYRGIGRLEAEAGRSLDSLQAAFRVGARLAWHRIVLFGQRAKLPLTTIGLLGDAALAHIDVLAALAVEGYADVRARTAGTVQYRRSRLLDGLVSDPPTPHEKLVDLAHAANWPLPRRVCTAALFRPADPDLNTMPRMPARLLADLDRPDPVLIVPEPDGRSWCDELTKPLRGWRMVVGPTVTVSEAGKSLRQALDMAAHIADGYVREAPVVWSADHLATLCMLRDEFLRRQLVENRLAPLLPLTSKQQQRVRRTLLAWLEARGGAPEIAARLEVHPQTVRYRMRQVEKLFGDQLANPDTRFEIELALRVAELGLSQDPAPAT